MVFERINIRQVPWEVLKTVSFSLGFQHLLRDLANINAWKNMFYPYIKVALGNKKKKKRKTWLNPFYWDSSYDIIILFW